MDLMLRAATLPTIRLSEEKVRDYIGCMKLPLYSKSGTPTQDNNVILAQMEKGFINLKPFKSVWKSKDDFLHDVSKYVNEIDFESICIRVQRSKEWNSYPEVFLYFFNDKSINFLIDGKVEIVNNIQCRFTYKSLLEEPKELTLCHMSQKLHLCRKAQREEAWIKLLSKTRELVIETLFMYRLDVKRIYSITGEDIASPSIMNAELNRIISTTGMDEELVNKINNLTITFDANDLTD